MFSFVMAGLVPAITMDKSYRFGAFFTASSRLAVADPGRSGFG
jgi:hypothetical protein